MSQAAALSIELRLLIYSAFICLILWIPYTLAMISVRGLGRAVGYPTGSYDDLPAWAQRGQRAHMNLIENLAPFAALVLVAHALGVSNATTVWGVQLFFWGRVVHALVMYFGIPWIRTLAFAVAWIGCLMILWAILVP